eukprot:scaffold302_cov397-Prasinococcus_capsulatus_cf.AAC.9
MDRCAPASNRQAAYVGWAEYRYSPRRILAAFGDMLWSIANVLPPTRGIARNAVLSHSLCAASIASCWNVQERILGIVSQSQLPGKSVVLGDKMQLAGAGSCAFPRSQAGGGWLGPARVFGAVERSAQGRGLLFGETRDLLPGHPRSTVLCQAAHQPGRKRHMGHTRRFSYSEPCSWPTITTEENASSVLSGKELTHAGGTLGYSRAG